MSAPPDDTSPPARPRRTLGLLALGVSVVALLVAVTATLVAIRATDNARAARDLATALGGVAPAPSAVAPAPPVPSEPAAGEDPAVPPSEPVDPLDPNATGEPTLTERTTYTPRYAKEPLTLTVPSYNREMAADLDEPRANVNAGAEIVVDKVCDLGAPVHASFVAGVDATTGATRDSTPADCVEKIRQAPVGPNATVPLRKSVVCADHLDAAASSGATAGGSSLVEVTDTNSDGTVQLSATAWDIQ